MKLVIVTTVPETLATILRGQPKWLAQYASVICVSSSGRMLENVRENEGVPLEEIEMCRGINPIKDLTSIFRMWKLLRKVKPDIVHSYTPKAGLVTMLAAFFVGTKVRIHTFTGLVFPTSVGLKRWILVWVDRIVCAAATHVVPEGKGVAADLQKYHITPKPLRIIGNGNIAGIDINYFHPDKVDPVDVSGKRAFTFGFVGRLNRDKGLDELVTAFEGLRGSARLLLVGGLDESAPISDDTYHKIKSNKHIHELGFLDDVRPALAACDVIVLASYREGFPNVVIQAGAMCKPVIASDVSGSNEIIEDGINGWLVPPKDSQALAERMNCVMELPEEELRSLGRSARARVVERYDQREYRQQLLAYYRRAALEACI